MDIELEFVELSEEEMERLEYEEKLENGEIEPIDQPLEFYLKKHPDSYHLIRDCADVIINNLNVKTVKEFIDDFDDTFRNRLIEFFPHLADPYISEQLDNEVTEMAGDVCETVELEIGG